MAPVTFLFTIFGCLLGCTLSTSCGSQGACDTVRDQSLLQRKSSQKKIHLSGSDRLVSGVKDSDWQIVFTEQPGTANGTAYDMSPERTLDFPQFKSAVAGYDYEVKLEWPAGWVTFVVPKKYNIFNQYRDPNIPISNIATSSDYLPDLGSTGWFCHACVANGLRWGDTCWAVLPLNDDYRECGCSSGNAIGEGIYYGGNKFQQRCHGRGGGFAGPKLNGQQRGDLSSIGLTFSIKILDNGEDDTTTTQTTTTTTTTTTTLPQQVCGPCSVVFSQGYAPGYGDTQGPTSTMTTMNQWVPSYSSGISSLILSGQGCQLQVRTTSGDQSYIYTPGVYNCGRLPNGSPSPQTCLPTGNDNMVASIMTCQASASTASTASIVYAVNSASNIWTRPADGSGSWTQVPGGLSWVSVGSQVWGVNSAQNIWRCQLPCTGGWSQVPGGLVQLDVGNTETWGVNAAQNIWMRPADGSGDWKQIPGGLTDVSVGLTWVWGVNSAQNIWRCQRPCTGNWQMVDGALVQLDVADTQMWGVNAGQNIWMRPADGSGSWIQIPGAAVDVSIGSTYVWVVNQGGNIFRCQLPCTGGWILIDGAAKQLDVSWAAAVSG